MSKEGKKFDWSIERHPNFKAHIEWAEKEGMCKQCQRPWHDGLCSCGKSDERMDTMASLAYKMFAAGWKQ